MSTATLVLRDIHQPDAPAWWPPAPGWWLLLGVIVLLAVLAGWWRRRRQRREQRVRALFDDALAAAGSPPARVAAMSELLRRASRRRDAGADRLEGEAWLAFLDGADRKGKPAKSKARDRTAEFSRGPGRLLLDGGFRREVPEHEVAALETLARARFLAWMLRR